MARTYQIITLFPRDTILHNVTLALLGLSKLRWNPFVALAHEHREPLDLRLAKRPRKLIPRRLIMRGNDNQRLIRAFA